MKRFFRFFFWWLGLGLSVLPPVFATLECFPIWAAEGGETVVSGLTAILLCLSALPLFRILREKLRSPSPFLLWLFLWALFSCLRRVIDGICTVALVAFPTAFLGAVFFRLSRWLKVP